MTKFWLRIFGAVLMIAGIYAWISGVIPVSLSYNNVSAVVPLHYVFILFGFLLLVLPLLPLHVIVALLPESKTQGLRTILEGADQVISPSEDVEETARQITKALRNYNRRYYITLFAIFLFLAFVLPFLTSELLDRRAFAAQSTQLSRMVQSIPVDPGSQDHFRSRLDELEPSLENYTSRRTATNELRGLLRAIFPVSGQNRVQFNLRMTAVYDSVLKGHILPGSGLVSHEFLDFACDRTLDPAVTCGSTPTLLGILAVRQGDQGRYLQPYLQARQLLGHAIDVVPSSTSLPAAHNARGLAYGALILRHKEYQQLFADATRRMQFAKALGEDQPLSILALARTADDDFSKAIADNTGAFNTIRSLNNRVDLRLHLLAMIHLDGVKLAASNEPESQFLQSNFDPPDGVSTWQPRHLPTILDSLVAQLNVASRLSSQPEVFVTRAQLFAIAGALHAKYGLSGEWADPQVLAHNAMRDLELAVRLGLPPQNLSPSRAAELRLSWLWTFASMQELYDRLRTDERAMGGTTG